MPYETKPLMSDTNIALLERSYHMSPESIASWFMDDTDHDMKYLDMLLTMADHFNWSEPEI